MRKGFTVRMGWNCGFGDTSLVITNYPFANQIVCYPMVNYILANRIPSDVGMWRIKILKK
jgi:hypothetical protein